MAFGVTTHCEGSDDTSSSTFETDGATFTVDVGGATWTPTANVLQVVILSPRRGGGNVGSATVTGHGLTYTEVASTTGSIGKRRMFAFTAIGASPTNGALDFSWSDSMNACQVWIGEVSGINTGGPTGVTDSAEESNLGDTQTLALALAAFADSGNMTFTASFCEDGANAFNIESGYTTEIDNENSETRLTVAHKSSEDDPTWTLDITSGDVQAGALAFEIIAGAPAAGVLNLVMAPYRPT